MKNKPSDNKLVVISLLFLFISAYSQLAIAQQSIITLSNDLVKLEWIKQNGGWRLHTYNGKVNGRFEPFGVALGEYNFIYSKNKPSLEPLSIVENGDTIRFPEKVFKYVYPKFQRAMSSVPMNKAGEHHFFFPSEASKRNDSLFFRKQTDFGLYESVWTFDKRFSTDIIIQLSFTATLEGYYSLPTPSLGIIKEEELEWGLVPGYFSGNQIQKHLPLSYVYAQGLPAYPVLCRESTITTMSSIMSNKNGLTMAVTPTPGQDRNPYTDNNFTHEKLWNIALSHMDSKSQLTPVAYHPVLGENQSYLKKGETVHFNFRVTLQQADWYATYKHVIYDIYQLNKSLELKKTGLSLSDRVQMLYKYVLDEQTALWQKEEYRGDTIAAQSYLGGVVGADKDAMKNSDIGAVWMLSKLAADTILQKNWLPFIKNFKIQQQVNDGFFKGAVQGQYYLAKKKKFTEEWGNHFEPIAITYYTMMDIGNILLFEKQDKELKKILRNGANRLLEWQKNDGSWVVAYDRDTQKAIYTDLEDLRPTFYGLIVAYKLLKDKKYLESAEKGAEWYINNAVKKGHFIGVCGDARFVNDFATAQGAMALLDLYELTGKNEYLIAAIQTAKIYTTSIYTHPIPDQSIKKVKNKEWQDWQLSQVGLNFEHGGSMGSAVDHGPILLTSHCSLFLKIYKLTNDSLFLDLARSAALGRDAFVNDQTKVASYYWKRFDEGAGPFPHHAWWQIGWIYDYLVSEAELRSNETISFSRGFMTPKVGPHKSLGFTAGLINGVSVNLVLRKKFAEISNPNIDCLSALSEDGKTLFLILLNQQDHANDFTIQLTTQQLGGRSFKLSPKQERIAEGFGIRILEIKGS